MPLTGSDNPLLCHYFCYYLKCIYDNEMFSIGNILSCSYGGLGRKSMTYIPSEQQEGKAYGCFTRLPVSGLGLFYIMISIPIHGGQNTNELRLQPLKPTQQWSCWRPWGCPTPVRRLTCLELTRDLISRGLSHLSLSGDLHPDPGTSDSQVVTVLGRISFRNTHP